MLTRLAYTSALDPAVGDVGKARIVSEASAANIVAEIGGVISFDGDRVCQILEGEEERVLGLFEKISSDPRHSGVFELDRSEVSERLFSEWGMANRPMVDMMMYAYSVLPN